MGDRHYMAQVNKLPAKKQTKCPAAEVLFFCFKTKKVVMVNRILTVVSLSLDANLLRDVPNQPDPAIQPNQACCVKPSLNGNSNSMTSNCLNLRRIREQRLFSAAVAARILKLSALANQGLALNTLINPLTPLLVSLILAGIWWWRTEF
ncbi:hypothetical protein WN944_026091 [Citrus x changshan-huyou]|uniref:Uncharacterized protein n=1 Tax=Citrus x changshan-huyou TaxID=2935761 RepID=A0AAP0QC29_9ROSI